MNRAAVAAFEWVAEHARRGRRRELARTLETALCMWDRPKSRLPRWFRVGARVSVVCDDPDGRTYVVRYVKYDRVLREHRFTLQGSADTMSGTISGYETGFPFKKERRASS